MGARMGSFKCEVGKCKQGGEVYARREVWLFHRIIRVYTELNIYIYKGPSLIKTNAIASFRGMGVKLMFHK